MVLRKCCLALLLWCVPLLTCAGVVPLRVVPLVQPPASMPQDVVPSAAGSVATTPRVWLHAPRDQSAWFAITLAEDWHGDSPPLLSIGGNVRARVTAYLPPDYQPHTETVFDASLDPTFSHRAVVFPLPASLRADQPIYLEMGDPGQTQPIRIAVADAAGYRAADLWHVRASTFFVSVQLSMLLVIFCFWLVLRDRMFLTFVAYVAALSIYAMAVSGELFVLPGARLLTPLGYRTGMMMAALAAGFSAAFILEFAELRQWTPRLAKLLSALRWLYFAFAVIVWLPFLRPDAWLPNTNNLLLVVTTVIALASTWLAWRRGNRQAGFFLLSWIPLLVLTVVRVVQLFAGFPLPAWLEYGFPGSMAWAATIITVGLADRTLQVRRERDQATRMAQFDPLTGVFNRRVINERLATAWREATVNAEPLAVLFLDIDRFKRINDSRGHAAGDACLIAVTEAIRAELGAADRVGRYGGEEFLILLRGASAPFAEQLAARIRTRAAALRVPLGDNPIALTVSIGVAMRDAATPGIDVLVARADAAQYRAKAEGRNRVVLWRRESFEAAAADAP